MYYFNIKMDPEYPYCIAMFLFMHLDRLQLRLSAPEALGKG